MTTLLLMYVIFGILLMALALPLLFSKVPPNPWYGFRVPSTLSDSKVWYEANRYAAWWLLLSGAVLVGAAVSFRLLWPDLAVDRYAWLCLVAFAVPFVPGVALSFRYLRRLNRRS